MEKINSALLIFSEAIKKTPNAPPSWGREAVSRIGIVGLENACRFSGTVPVDGKSGPWPRIPWRWPDLDRVRDRCGGEPGRVISTNATEDGLKLLTSISRALFERVLLRPGFCLSTRHGQRKRIA